MNQIANMLKAHGIKKGDCVAIYSHASNYIVACMLACARIGAVHNSIYSEFPPHAIAMRINEGLSFIQFLGFIWHFIKTANIQLNS